MADTEEHQEPAVAERVSLWPLDPITALRAALQVDPNSPPDRIGTDSEDGDGAARPGSS